MYAPHPPFPHHVPHFHFCYSIADSQTSRALAVALECTVAIGLSASSSNKIGRVPHYMFGDQVRSLILFHLESCCRSFTRARILDEEAAHPTLMAFQKLRPTNFLHPISHPAHAPS